MSWNTSLISGPWQVPIYGTSTTDANGNPVTPITGYQAGEVFVLPASAVTAALQQYAGPVPAGVPVLGGEPCEALTFPDLATAQTALAAYWTATP